MSLTKIIISSALLFLAETTVVVAQEARQASGASGIEAHAIYCLEVNKLSLIALERIYATMPGAAMSKNGLAQLEQHKSRIDILNRYIAPRTNHIAPSFVKQMTAWGGADFQQSGQDAMNCTNACKDDSCRASCITHPTLIENRVRSCLQLSWLTQ